MTSKIFGAILLIAGGSLAMLGAPDPKLDRRCFFIVRDARGQALAYVYFEEGTRGGQAPHP